MLTSRLDLDVRDPPPATNSLSIIPPPLVHVRHTKMSLSNFVAGAPSGRAPSERNHVFSFLLVPKEIKDVVDLSPVQLEKIIVTSRDTNLLVSVPATLGTALKEWLGPLDSDRDRRSEPWMSRTGSWACMLSTAGRRDRPGTGPQKRERPTAPGDRPA